MFPYLSVYLQLELLANTCSYLSTATHGHTGSGSHTAVMDDHAETLPPHIYL